MRWCSRFRMRSWASWESRNYPVARLNLLRVKIISNNPEHLYRHSIYQLWLEACSFRSLYRRCSQRLWAKGRLSGNNLPSFIKEHLYLHLTTDVIFLCLSRVNRFWQITRQVVENAEVSRSIVVRVRVPT